MHPLTPVILAGLISGILAGLGAYVAVRVSIAEVAADLGNIKERLGTVEARVALDGTDSTPFMRRTECPLLDHGIQRDMNELHASVATLTERVRLMGEEVHALTRAQVETKRKYG